MTRKMVLAYHQITPSTSAYSYSISRDRFDAHLQVIAEMQRDASHAASTPEVTFDDGHRSNYVHGLDLLQTGGVRATFFVVASWMSARADFMSWPELKELLSLGHQVQSHSWSHRALTECSGLELKEELERSRRTLEDRLGSPVEALSVPHGKWDDRVLRACAEAGYRRIYISDPWLQPQQREGVELIGRYMVRRSLKAAKLRRLLEGDPALLFFLRSQYHAKEIVKRFLGHSAYHRLWLFFSASDSMHLPKGVE